jgi:hypothetical protein
VTQIIATWTHSGHGTFKWDTATNWSGDVVPNGGNFNAFLTRSGPAYTVVASGAGGHEVGLLETNPNATLNISADAFNVANALANTGVINVDSTAGGEATFFLGNGSTTFSYGNSGVINLLGVASAAFLTFADVTTELVGGGAINLSGQASISAGVAGDTVVNYDNTIQGPGSIGGLLAIDNQALGTIDANAATNLTIEAERLTNDGTIETTGSGGLVIIGGGNTSGDSNFTNEGALIASGSGPLTLNSVYVTGGGVAETTAKGATILLDDSTLDLAEISIAAQSFLRTVAGTTNEIDGFVFNSGTITVVNGSTLLADIDLAGAGVLRINSTAGAGKLPTALGLDGDSEIEAGARVILSAAGDNSISSDGPAVALVNSGSISGAGTIGDENLRIVNRKSGIIDAQGSAGLDLVVNENGSEAFNGGLIEATGAGVLTISASTPGTALGFVNSGEIDDADATTLTLSDLSIMTGGGTIEATVSGATISLHDVTIASGIVSLVAGSTLQAANSDVNWIETHVNNAGAIVIGGDETLDVDGNWVNSGAIDVYNNLDIAGGSRLTLRGGGAINLIASGLIQSDDGIGGSGTASLLNLSDTIVGSGEIIDSNLTLDNGKFGTIDATGSGHMLINTGSNDVVNQGTIEASNSGPAATSATLIVYSELENSGQVIAGRGSWIDLSNNAVGGGVARINSTGELEMDGEDSLNVVFNATAHGTLALDDSATSSYGGIISGFAANDKIDLSDIAFIQGTTNAAFFGNAVQGQLSVTDGTNTTTLRMLGNHVGQTFSVAADGHGGTIVTV